MSSSLYYPEQASSEGDRFGISRRDLLVLGALGLASRRASLGRRRAGRPADLGVHVSLAPTWFDPAETPGIITPFMVLYALHDAHGEADAGQACDAEPGRVVVGVGGRADLRVRAARGREVPQRRAGHRRGREVLVRALPRRRATIAEGAGRGGRRSPMRGTSASS